MIVSHSFTPPSLDDSQPLGGDVFKKQVTFVTSIFDIYNNTFEDKTLEWRLNKFRDIIETGIYLCVYTSPDCYDTLAKFIQPYPNVQIMKQIRNEDFFSKKTCEEIEYSLPEHRNYQKDIPDYMHLIQSKPEFLYDAIQKNPWSSTHFAWIDFSISYIFQSKKETIEYLAILGKRTFIEEPFLVIPGCLEKPSFVDNRIYENDVIWRFCGGFLLGDADSIVAFYHLYIHYYPEFLRTHKKLVWEVNFWAWLEANGHWNPRWYNADHNDSIFKIPIDIYSICIKKDLVIHTYPYPLIEHFEPMNASYIVYKNKHILNTRYVNYQYLESGHCNIRHPENTVITRNFYSELDPVTLYPISTNEMQDDTVDLYRRRFEMGHPFGVSLQIDGDIRPCEESNVPFEFFKGLLSKPSQFYGLEDVRLYEYDGKLRFIATNVNYSPIDKNRMIVGDYHPETLSYSNCHIIDPPYDNLCEKNWIPIKSPDDEIQGEYFIYKWFPMEIGRLDINTDTSFYTSLNIIKSYPILAPDFYRARGSTRFIDNGEYLIGLVHLNEHILPARYYHIMVALDRHTLQPIKYSQTFHFLQLEIEYCLGFEIREENYVFWISSLDRNPKMLHISIENIPLVFDF